VGQAVLLLPTGHGLGRGDRAEVQLAVADSPRYTVMLGTVTEVAPAGHLLQRVTVRELSAALETSLAIQLFQATPANVLSHLERRTGLSFLLPRQGAYLRQPCRLFDVRGTGLEVLAQMARVWPGAEAVWTQLPDGRIYWGDWRTAPYTGGTLPLGPELIVAREARALELHCFPGLRPGMVLEPKGGPRLRLLARTVSFRGTTVRAAGTPLKEPGR